MMGNFKTKWKTPSSTLANITEGNSWTYALNANCEYSLMGQLGQIYVDIENHTVSNIYKNNILLVNGTDYFIYGHTVSFVIPLNTNDLIVIQTITPITYSLLNNNLPNGITLSSSGVLSGVMGELPNTTGDVLYTFTIRATDGITISDRTFYINGLHTMVVSDPPSWGNLPLEVSYNGLFTYVPIGRSAKDVNFSYNIDLYTPSGKLPVLVLSAINEVSSPYNKIPKGLTVQNNGTISGTIDTSNHIGTYFFELTMLDNNGNPITSGSGQFPKIFMIEISAPLTVLQPLRFIQWNTVSGLLGSLDEFLPCPFSVSANCSTGETILYTLKNGTSLPSGFSIDKYSGEIIGVASHVNTSQTYNFTIRATVDNTDIYSDRSFSITIISKYNTSSTVSVFVSLSSRDYIPLSNYYASVIDDNDYFRTDDSNFLPVTQKNNMSMLVIGGLSSTLPNMKSVIRDSNFKAPLTVLLGTHKLAKVKIGSTVLYEVIYREVIDLQEGAGSYKIINGNPISNPVTYPQNPSMTVYPMSIDNLRYYLLNSVKFATSDISLQTYIGINNIENLPLWMTSTQDDGSVLGYVKAFEIATVKPGKGQSIVDTINNRLTINTEKDALSTSINKNHRSDFDQVFVQMVSTSDQSTFFYSETNHSEVSFDYGTNFDAFLQYDGQIVRMFMI